MSVAAPGAISPEILKEAFERNKVTLAPIFFKDSNIAEVTYSDGIVCQNTLLLHCLLEDIADVRIKGLGTIDFIENKSTDNKDLYHDLLDLPDIVASVEVDSDELEKVGSDFATCGSPRCAFQADCVGISDLEFYDKAVASDNPFNNKIVALSLSNNQLTNSAFDCSQLPNSTTILQLNIGGNSLQYTPKLPPNLLFLDLSYSEELKFTCCGMFTACPQLLRLVLDGCGLTSTSSAANDPNIQSSIFFGLARLKELSLKENMFEEVAHLAGLNYFSKKSLSIDNARVSATTEQNVESAEISSLHATLHTINISSNPLCESTSGRKDVMEYLTNTITSLSIVDDKYIRQKDEVAIIDKSSAAYTSQHHVISDNDMITETMAQEYAAALKGERDNTVIN